ncbi:hypothetical protein PBAC_31920 [Pedobacter glucosidilyticus]|nr:hypothetical protein PBAC_31920 [Pedobacter glucosidilyticus]
MDFLFYVMYNMYYKDGEYKNDKPAFTVFCQFVACIFGFLAGLTNLYFWYVKGACYIYIFTINHWFFFLLSSSIITYLLFYYNKRYLKIYENYKNNYVGNHYITRLIAIILMFFLLLFGLVVSYIKRQYIFCP